MMILSLSGLCLENLPVGPLRRTTIDGIQARDMIAAAADRDRLIGIHEFGPVPDPAADKRFGQLLAALRDVYDIELDRKAFFSELETDDDDPQGTVTGYANPPQLYEAGLSSPILVVGYVFSPSEGDDYFDMDVVADRLTFDLVEVVAETKP